MRIFFAIDMPSEIKKLASSLSQAQRYRGFRWTKPENLHVTLLFLGEMSDMSLPRIIDAGESIAHHAPPFSIVFETILSAPPERHPRMVWLTGKTPLQFQKLARDLSKATGVSVHHSPTLHLTLARSREIIPQSQRFAPKTVALPPIEIREFVLMESKLSRGGRIYMPLKVFSLNTTSS